MLSERVPDPHTSSMGVIDVIQGLNDESFHPQVGSLVCVQSRTWAGINKPGGVGRVSKVYYDSDIPTHVDVKYIVNSGRENHVEMIFVESYSLENPQKQQRRADSSTTEAAASSHIATVDDDFIATTSDAVERKNRRSHIPSLAMEESKNIKSSDQQKREGKNEKKKINDASLKKRATLVENTHHPTQSPTKRKSHDNKNNITETVIPCVQKLKQDIDHNEPTSSAHGTETTFSHEEEKSVLVSDINPIQQEITYDRIHSFTSLLNKIRIDASLEAINVSDLLIRINNHTASSGEIDEYSNDELQFYLKILEKENKLMITWEDSMIYWI